MERGDWLPVYCFYTVSLARFLVFHIRATEKRSGVTQLVTPGNYPNQLDLDAHGSRPQSRVLTSITSSASIHILALQRLVLIARNPNPTLPA